MGVSQTLHYRHLLNTDTPLPQQCHSKVGFIGGGGGWVGLRSGQLTICCLIPQSIATVCFLVIAHSIISRGKCVIEVWKRTLPSLEVLSLSCGPPLVSASAYRLLFLV